MMRRPTITTTLALTSLLLVATAQAEQEAVPAWVEKARGGAAALAGELQQALMSAMEADGPVAAIEVCRHQAPEIAERVSDDHMEVGRTALRVRNPDNHPDAWEQETLREFQARLESGESPETVQAFRVESTDAGREGRWMRAIPTQPMCLSCHGSNLSPDVAGAIDRHYPDDEARGFSAGELRGAFTVRVLLERDEYK